MNVAFLRGMNLGRRRITNVELTRIFEDLGFSQVACYRASGNVMFSGDATEEGIAAGLEDALGYGVLSFLRTAEELAAIVQFEAFTPAEIEARGKVQVTLLKTSPDAETTAAALAFASEDDLLVLNGRELYWLPRAGISTSELDHKGLDRVLGLGTTRTWHSEQHRQEVRLLSVKRFGHALLLLGLFAWVIAGLASVVHETETRHVACADHGETVELGTEGMADAVDTLRAQDVGAEHGHGCLLDGLVSTPSLEHPPNSFHETQQPEIELHALSSVESTSTILMDAPKTSPPERI